MTADLARIADATGYNRAQVELVKDTIARGASDDELMLFLHLAQRTGLDPFSRQIYLIERKSQVNGEWKTTRQPQTGIDGLRLTADRTGNYAPGRAPTFEYDASGKLFSATSYVWKFVRNDWREVAATAHYAEYVQLKRDGNPTQMWADKPHIMLAKCAEALALRRAFPADLSGLYTSDEIRDRDEVVVSPPRPVVATAQAPRALPPAPAANPATGEVIEQVIWPKASAESVARLKALRDAERSHIAPPPSFIYQPGKMSPSVVDDEIEASRQRIIAALELQPADTPEIASDAELVTLLIAKNAPDEVVDEPA